MGFEQINVLENRLLTYLESAHEILNSLILAVPKEAQLALANKNTTDEKIAALKKFNDARTQETITHLKILALIEALRKQTTITPQTSLEILETLTNSETNFYQQLLIANEQTKVLFAQIILETQYLSIIRESVKPMSRVHSSDAISTKERSNDGFKQKQKQLAQLTHAIAKLEDYQFKKTDESFSEAWLVNECQNQIKTNHQTNLLKFDDNIGLFVLTEEGAARARAIIEFALKQRENNNNIRTSDLILITLYLGRKNIEARAQDYSIRGDGSALRPFSFDNLRAILIGFTAQFGEAELIQIPAKNHEEIKNLTEEIKDLCAQSNNPLGRSERILYDFMNLAQNPMPEPDHAATNTLYKRTKLRAKKFVASVKRAARAQSYGAIDSAPEKYSQFFLAQGNIGGYLAATAFLTAATHLQPNNKPYQKYLEDLAAVSAERIDYVAPNNINVNKSDPNNEIIQRLNDSQNYPDFCQWYPSFKIKNAHPEEAAAIQNFYELREQNSEAHEADVIAAYQKAVHVIHNKVAEIRDLSRASRMTHTLAYKDTYNSPAHVYPLEDYNHNQIDCHAQGVIKDEMGLGVTFFTPKDLLNCPGDTVPLFITLPGTHDQAGALRDFDPISAGFAAWMGNSEYRLRVADALNAAIKKLTLETGKKVSIEIFGHSLGGGDALQMELLIMEAMAQNINSSDEASTIDDQIHAFEKNSRDPSLGKRLAQGLRSACGRQPRRFNHLGSYDRRFPAKLDIGTINKANIARIATYADRGSGEHPSQNLSRCACMAFFAKLGVKFHSRTIDVEGDMLSWLVPLTGPYYIDANESYFNDPEVKNNLDILYVQTKTNIGLSKWGWLVNAATRAKFSLADAHTTKYLQQSDKYSQEYAFARGNDEVQNNYFKRRVSASRVRLLNFKNKTLIHWDVIGGYTVRSTRYVWQKGVLIIRIALELVKNIIDPIFNAGNDPDLDTPSCGLESFEQKKTDDAQNLIRSFQEYAATDKDFLTNVNTTAATLTNDNAHSKELKDLLHYKLNDILNDAIISFPDLVDEYESKLNYWALFCDQTDNQAFRADHYRDRIFKSLENKGLKIVNQELTQIISEIDLQQPSEMRDEFLKSIRALQTHITLILQIRTVLSTKDNTAALQNLIQTLTQDHAIKNPSFDDYDPSNPALIETLAGLAEPQRKDLLSRLAALRELDITHKHTTQLVLKTLLAVDICIQQQLPEKQQGEAFIKHSTFKARNQLTQPHIPVLTALKNKYRIRKGAEHYAKLVDAYNADENESHVRISSQWQFEQLQKIALETEYLKPRAKVAIIPKNFKLSDTGIAYARQLINIAIREPDNNISLTEQDLALIVQFFSVGLFSKMAVRYGLMGNASADHPFTMDNLRAVLIGIAVNSKEKDLFWLSKIQRPIVQAEIKKIRSHVRVPSAHLGTSKRMITDLYYREQNALPAGSNNAGRIYRRLMRWLSRSIPMVFQNASLVAGQYYVALGYFGVGQLTNIIPPDNACAYNFAKDVQRLYSEESVTELVRDDDENSPVRIPVPKDLLTQPQGINGLGEEAKRGSIQLPKSNSHAHLPHTLQVKSDEKQREAKREQILAVAEVCKNNQEFCHYYPYFHEANFDNAQQIKNYFADKNGETFTALVKLIDAHADICDQELLVAPTISDVRRNAALAEMLQTAEFVKNHEEFCHFYPMYAEANASKTEVDLLNEYFSDKSKDSTKNIKDLFQTRLRQIDQWARAEIMAHDLANLSDKSVPKERGMRFMDQNLKECRYDMKHVKDTGVRSLDLKIFTPVQNQVFEDNQEIPVMIAIPEIVNEIILFDFMRPFVHSAIQYYRGRNVLVGTSEKQIANQKKILAAIDEAIAKTTKQHPGKKIRLEIFGHSSAGSLAVQLELLIMQRFAANHYHGKTIENKDIYNLSYNRSEKLREDLQESKKEVLSQYSKMLDDDMPGNHLHSENISTIYTFNDRGVGERPWTARQRAVLSAYLGYHPVENKHGIKLHRVIVDRDGDATKYLAADDAERYIKRDKDFFKNRSIVTEHIMAHTNKGYTDNGWWKNRMAKGEMTSWYVHRERQFQGPERYHTPFEIISTNSTDGQERLLKRILKKLGRGKEGHKIHNFLLRGILAKTTLLLSYGFIRGFTITFHARIWHYLTRKPREKFYETVLSTADIDVLHNGNTHLEMDNWQPYIDTSMSAYKSFKDKQLPLQIVKAASTNILVTDTAVAEQIPEIVFQKAVSIPKFTVQEIEHNGNCMYAAIVNQLQRLGRTTYTHESLRAMVVAELSNNFDRYKNDVQAEWSFHMEATHQSYDKQADFSQQQYFEYLEYLSGDGHFAAELSLAILAKLLKINISVNVLADKPFTREYKTANLYLDCKTIHLQHTPKNGQHAAHYDSLVRAADLRAGQDRRSGIVNK